jgi:hypothetical protein
MAYIHYCRAGWNKGLGDMSVRELLEFPVHKTTGSHALASHGYCAFSELSSDQFHRSISSPQIDLHRHMYP